MQTKSLQIFLLVLIIIGLGLLATQDKWVPKLVEIILSGEKSTKTKSTETETNSGKVAVISTDINEANFTGKKAVIAGNGLLVTESNKYIEATIAEFKKRADVDVPDMRRQFGVDNPTANYSIDITAKEISSANITSVVMSIYTYTGGAHGSSYYKVFNVSEDESKLLALVDVMKADKQLAFAELVKKELHNWLPEGSPVIFPEEVDKLTFNSFKNWALDTNSIIIYFDQYEIGPGVLGAVAFPISLEKIQDMLN